VWINADNARIAQAVGNLLQNAAKFTCRGDHVVLSLDQDAGEGMADIRVRDTGVGIEPELLGELFQPFMQADSSLDRSKGGLGLGLALVKGVAELHGGTIQARSEGLGHGAEFSLRLPIGHPPDSAVAEAQPERRIARSMRILVVEDNVDAADSIRDVLSLCEQQVEVVHDGREAVVRARTLRPDLILCDIGLPGIDGYEVARLLRQEPGLEHTRLIALTGYALPEDVKRAADAGFDGHLAKPPSIDDLQGLLQKASSPGNVIDGDTDQNEIVASCGPASLQ